MKQIANLVAKSEQTTVIFANSAHDGSVFLDNLVTHMNQLNRIGLSEMTESQVKFSQFLDVKEAVENTTKALLSGLNTLDAEHKTETVTTELKTSILRIKVTAEKLFGFEANPWFIDYTPKSKDIFEGDLFEFITDRPEGVGEFNIPWTLTKDLSAESFLFETTNKIVKKILKSNPRNQLILAIDIGNKHMAELAAVLQSYLEAHNFKEYNLKLILSTEVLKGVDFMPNFKTPVNSIVLNNIFIEKLKASKDETTINKLLSLKENECFWRDEHFKDGTILKYRD